MKRARRGAWVIVALVFLALLLVIVPLPEFVAWARPSFPLLVVVYWSMALPERHGTWTGFIVGLAVDVLLAIPLGMHALSFSLAAWASSRLAARMRVYPPLQQASAVALIAGVAFVVERIAAKLTGTHVGPLLPSLLSVAVTALIWPWAFAVQDRMRRVLGVN